VKQLSTFVLGDGPELERLMARFPAARFIGHVERAQALAYISAADVLVSASLREGAPSVVREARALGTPVVCLEAGDVKKWAETDPGLSVVL
jgi:glycosyltransferase involved in cell wall biosynthesis